MTVFLKFAILFNLILQFTQAEEFKIDTSGYIVFCPCMGRFGNQMDQLLGSLAFAKGLGRTMVLPHLVEYPERAYGSTYFKIEPLQEYTKVILMDDFMKHIAPTVWPKGKRVSFCYSSRGDNRCNAKEGNPFGPYWDKFGVDFDKDEFYGPLGYDPTFRNHMVEWNTRYPSAKYPVLAFTGQPGAFPVQEINVPLQKYIKWSDGINKRADEVIAKLKSEPSDRFIALHLRNGVDFKKACEHTKTSKDNFFASAQCLGYRKEHGELTEELCYPSDKTVLKQLKKAINKYNATAVYVATDGDDMINKFRAKFKNVKFVKNSDNSPHVDLCVLGKADHAIVNCVSTFSAFAKRQRDSENKTTDFWAFKSPNRKQEAGKDEL